MIHYLSTFWKFLFPIQKSEAKKFIPMTLLMFFILFNFSVLRPLKDSLVIPNVGAEVISFIKLWCVLPSAILFTLLYVKLSNMFTAEKVFYIVTSIFIGFFALFALFLYPNQLAIHPDPSVIEELSLALPPLKWLIRIWGKWSFAVFYIFAELWGAAMLNLSFWQFANQITHTEEARRFYPLFGLIGNTALILAGGSIKAFASLEGGGELIGYSMAALIFSGFAIMAIYRWMHVFVLPDRRYYQPKEKSGKVKVKLSIPESFKLILHSRYLGLIVLLVLSYGISINLVEGPWKAKVRELYPTQNEYAIFMGEFIQWTGAATIVFMLMGSNILRRTSWLFSAITTPLMILITGVGFYFFVIYGSHMDDLMLRYFHLSPLAIAVFLGALQNVLSKATKYTMFDATKEMTFIPLDNELKTKGKAAVDVIGGRLAKSGGAVIQSGIFMLFPVATFIDITPYLMVIFVGIMMSWVVAVRRLNKAYTALKPEQY